VADHLTEEEQLEQFKNWWKANGASLAIAILVGLIAYFGFQWWQNNQQQQAEQASALYSELIEAIQPAPVSSNQPISDEKKQTAYYITEQLQTDYSGSQYAVNASLFTAKIAIEYNNIDAAEKALQWAVNNSNGALKGVASLRLARLNLLQDKYDDALALINTNGDALKSLNAELRGDILAAKNDIDGARNAYQEALDNVGETASFRRQLLPIKLANLVPSGES
jgi:predicted negative regulator of RcsB-dependent stress response